MSNLANLTDAQIYSIYCDYGQSVKDQTKGTIAKLRADETGAFRTRVIAACKKALAEQNEVLYICFMVALQITEPQEFTTEEESEILVNELASDDPETVIEACQKLEYSSPTPVILSALRTAQEDGNMYVRHAADNTIAILQKGA